ncbi:MAG: hypothetical protein JSV44_07955, partial [Candidatus Zixiibacteriota bacterium]
EYAAPRVTVAQYLLLFGHNAIFWSVTADPLTYGGGVDVTRSRMMLTYAVSHHPTLGFTHAISLGLTMDSR